MRQAIFYERAPLNRLKRPPPFSYEEAVFALSTFCRPSLPSLMPLVRYKALYTSYLRGF